MLAALPKSAHPGAKKALAEIWNTEDHRHALEAVPSRLPMREASRAVAKITEDVDQLLAFFDFPAEHWQHLRTTNPIVMVVIAVVFLARATEIVSQVTAAHGPV